MPLHEVTVHPFKKEKKTLSLVLLFLFIITLYNALFPNLVFPNFSFSSILFFISIAHSRVTKHNVIDLFESDSYY